MDAAIVASEPIGVDAEWRPRLLYEGEAADVPLALLQLATPARTFLIDMLAVSRDPGLALSLQATVRRVMQAPGVVKLGFAMQEDLRRLEAALPGATDPAASIVTGPGLTKAFTGESAMLIVRLSSARSIIFRR